MPISRAQCRISTPPRGGCRAARASSPEWRLAITPPHAIPYAGAYSIRSTLKCVGLVTVCNAQTGRSLIHFNYFFFLLIIIDIKFIRLLAGRISTTPLITLFAQGSLHTDDPRMKRQSEGRRLKTHPIDTLRRLRRPQLDGGNRDVIYRLLTSSFRSRPLWVASWGSESDQRSGAGTPREDTIK